VGGVPAWQLLDKAGLRGHKVGGVEISTKHANFLINAGEATYADAKAVVDAAKKAIPAQLEVEMRFIENDGSLAY
jgi:UDP-N-acetylmuramate dehydrogenase